MAKPNPVTHIMLDLEIADIDSDSPAIIELAAIHFDLDGKQSNKISEIIQLESYTDLGLSTGQETMIWLQKNIPTTLHASKSTKSSLPKVMSKFTRFLEICHKSTRQKHPNSTPELWLWGNGSDADNKWFRNA
jgi:hypothetical protein